jgi:hypothetical protein
VRFLGTLTVLFSISTIIVYSSLTGVDVFDVVGGNVLVAAVDVVVGVVVTVVTGAPGCGNKTRAYIAITTAITTTAVIVMSRVFEFTIYTSSHSPRS